MLILDAITFDFKRGEILVPEEDAIPFRSTSSTGIGIQRTSERGPGFTLTLVRYINPVDIAVERSTYRGKIGTLVALTDYYNGTPIQYSLSSLLFAVTQARVVNTQVISSFQGYVNGSLVKLTPAARVVSQWTMYAKSTT